MRPGIVELIAKTLNFIMTLAKHLYSVWNLLHMWIGMKSYKRFKMKHGKQGFCY